jgi:hypothetical protein
MFISKNLSNQLSELFLFNAEKHRKETKEYFDAKNNGDVPGWAFSLKNTDFKKNIYYVTTPVTKAKDVFVDKLNENSAISYEWAKNGKDFQKCIILPYMFPDNIFLVEKKGMKVFIGQFVFVKTIKDYIGIISLYDYSVRGDGSALWLSHTINFKMEDADVMTERNFSIIPYFIFFDYAEIEEKIVKAGTKSKGISKKSGDTNLSNFDVKRIDSMYFTRIIREEGFSVSGHFRLQPCGEGLRDRKLIYINPFEKNGYTRRAKIEMD